jgi:hypothetical protein
VLHHPASEERTLVARKMKLDDGKSVAKLVGSD